MKGHKGNHHRGKHASGGVVEQENTPSDTYSGASSNVKKEAAERKRGGRAKDAPMFGGKGAKNAGRKPRKSGGKVGADSNPFSSAKNGTPAKGRSGMSC